MSINKPPFNIFTAILFFLMGMNFMNWFYYLAVIISVRMFIFSTHNQVVKIDINAILVFLFCTFYCLFAPSDMLYGINAVIKIFSYFLGYLVGKKVIQTKNTNENLIVNYISILAIGSALLGTLNLFYNVERFGIFGFKRIMPGFWTGDLYGATAQSALFLLLSGISFYVLFFLKQRLLLKLTILAGILLLILNALLTSSRTSIIYPVVIIMTSFLSYLLLKKKFPFKYLFLLSFILVLVVLYESNLWEVKNFVEGLPLIERLNRVDYIPVIGDARLGVYSFFIQNMADYPFGGLNAINPIFYMHNLWLDVYAVSGIFAFMFLILFTVRIFINVIKLINHSRVNNGFKVFLIGTYLSFFLLFMTEPILLANPWFFIIFCLIAGMTDKYLDNINAIRIKIFQRQIKGVTL